MRFEVNKHYLAIGYNVEFKHGGRTRVGCSSKFIPWDDEIIDLKIIKLICTDHFKVPSIHNAEPNCDGFLFKTDNGHVYSNQYPVASYGQLSDRADNIIRRELSDETSYDVTGKEIYHYFGAHRYFEELLRGWYEVKKEDEVKASMLLHHYTYLIDKIRKEHNAVVTNKLDTELGGGPGWFDVTITFIPPKPGPNEDDPRDGNYVRKTQGGDHWAS